MNRILSAGLVVLIVSGCATDVHDAYGPLAPPPIAASFSGVIESASGSAHRVRPLPDGELWVLTFNAVKREDGTVTGYAHVDRKDLNIAWDVDVTCLSVVGNTAWIGGIIRNGTGVAIDGSVSYFYVIDNGEGSADPLDEASAVRLNDVAGEDIRFCTERPLLLPKSAIAHGNVQVQ